jgi:selenocysteine lyase/cysteine desulfurase
LGAGRDEIGFTTNTSHGMNLSGAISEKYKRRQRRRQRAATVLTMRDEFPSTTFPWINQKTDIKFVEPVNNTYPIEAI